MGIPQLPNALAPQHQQGQMTPPGFAHPGAQFLGPPAQAPGGQIPVDPPMGGMGGHPQMGGGLMGMMGDYRNALMDWRGQRPDHPQGPMDPTQMQDWRSQMQDWRQQRPDLMGYLPFGHGGGGPVMQPGGGTTGAPLQPTQVGMVPGVPGSMGTNPAASPPAVPPTYQFPGY